jgi:hypothetical protein
MGIRKAAILGGLVALFLAFLNYPPYAGEADDDHGSICWESTVERDDNGADVFWHYKRTVTNRNNRLKCRINWIPADWKGTVEPNRTMVAGDHKSRLPPDTRNGILLYNGGVPGEGKASAPVWDPVTMKSIAVENSVIWDSSSLTDLTFDVGERHYDLRVEAYCKIGREEDVNYIDYQVIAKGVRDIPQLRFIWDSVQSPEWVKKFDGAYLRFDSKDSVVGRLTSRLRFPVFRNGPIRVVDSSDKTIAQGWFPAWAFPKD